MVGFGKTTAEGSEPLEESDAFEDFWGRAGKFSDCGENTTGVWKLETPPAGNGDGGVGNCIEPELIGPSIAPPGAKKFGLIALL